MILYSQVVAITSIFSVRNTLIHKSKSLKVISQSPLSPCLRSNSSFTPSESSFPARPISISPRAIDPNFVTGFSDGECCFSIIFIKSLTSPTGYKIQLVYKIKLHEKDHALLATIKAYFGVGNLSK